MLELAFETKELRDLCEDGASAIEQYGAEIASSLWDRVADLRAASHPLELPLAVVRPIVGMDATHIVIELAEGFSLVLAANHRRPPLGDDGSIAWERVSRVRILRLDSPHG